jgi:hypothetical protein
MRIFISFLLFAGSVMRADTLSDLKTALAALDDRGTFKARVEVGSVQHYDEAAKDDPAALTVAALVEDGPQGLTIIWDRTLLQAAATEVDAKGKDANKSTPTRSSMDDLKPSALSEYLNARSRVLRLLDQAQLTAEKEVVWEGQPTRLLTFKWNPPLSDRDKKVIKEVEGTVRLWLGADGLPAAVETKAHAKGRALLIISFETTETEEIRFAKTGGRLVMTRYGHETQSSGGGQSGVKKSFVTLQPLTP